MNAGIAAATVISRLPASPESPTAGKGHHACHMRSGRLRQ